jgi:sec-independent protein translocase protein TatB
MFDIGWGELVVIGVVALIVIGPKELPTVLRTLGQTMGKVKRMANEFQGQFQEALREAELHDIKKQAEDFTSDINSSMTELSDFDPMADTQKEIEGALAEPASEAATTEAEAGAAAPAPEAAPAAAALPAPAMEPLQAPAPVAVEDFAPAEPQRKPAEGSA